MLRFSFYKLVNNPWKYLRRYIRHVLYFDLMAFFIFVKILFNAAQPGVGRVQVLGSKFQAAGEVFVKTIIRLVR